MSDNPATRVLVVSQFFPPEGQGGGHRWQRFIREAPQDELQYRVVCPPPTYPYGEFDRTYRPWSVDEVDGIPVTRLWTYQPESDAGSLARVLNYGVFAVLAAIYVLCNAWRYDCIVTMSTPHTTFFAGAVGKLLGRSWVVDIFDLWLDNAADLGYADESSLAYRLIARLERMAFTRADHIIVLTPTMKQLYREKYNIPSERLTPIPFGVDEQLFTPNLDREPQDRLIYVGNLGSFYAFEPYFRAFAKLESKYELVVVGWGEERERLEKLCVKLGIEERVTFTGRVPREEVPSYFESAALNWVPLKTHYNLDYARPTKLLEGMAMGTPYVASPIAEIQVVTEESNAGIVVENDPERLASEMGALLGDESRRRQMSRRAVNYIDTHHRWENLAQQTNRIILSATTS